MTEKTRMNLLIGLLLILLLAGCNYPTSPESLASAEGVGVWFDKPLDGAQYELGPVEIVFHTADLSGTASYRVYINDGVIAEEDGGLGEDTLLTHALVWQPETPGEYQIKARATSNAGESIETIVTIEVAAPPTETAVPTAAFTAEPTATATATATPTPTETPAPTATLEPLQFGAPSVSAEVFYYRFSDCPGRSPNEVTIELTVTDPLGISAVDIHFRIEKYGNGEITDWIVQGMTSVGGNLYRTTIDSDQLPSTAAGAELQYRIYATNGRGETVNGPLFTNVRVLGCGS